MNCSFNIRYKPRTTRAFTKSDLTVYDSAGNTALNALTVYGKSEIVDGAIVSAGEGYAVVRLADLTWNKFENMFYTSNLRNIVAPFVSSDTIPNILSNQYITTSLNNLISINKSITVDRANDVNIRDNNYTTVSDFIASLGDTTLCYELADPSQGNCIAVKTDNGTGVNGTMTVFETGTPLRGIPDTTARDVMAWDGSAGTVTKNCANVRLADLTWNSMPDSSGIIFFYTPSPSLSNKASGSAAMICTKYRTVGPDRDALRQNNKAIAPYNITSPLVAIRDDDYTTVSDFVASLGDAELVYELATPITQNLTTAENASFATLRTFEPQTHAKNNAQTDMTVDYAIRVPTN